MNLSDQSTLDHAETLIRVMRLDNPEFQNSHTIEALNLIRKHGTPEALASIAAQLTSGILAVHHLHGTDTVSNLGATMGDMAQALVALETLGERLEAVDEAV